MTPVALRVAVGLSVLLGGWAAPLEGAQQLRIEKVRVEPKTIDVVNGQHVTIQFDITQKAFVTMNLYDENGNWLNRVEQGLRPAGEQRIQWDGRDAQGRVVSTDVVLYALEARTEDRQENAYYNPAPETSGLELKGFRFTLDKATGRVSYILPNAARVRLRAGLNSGALLKTVYDWEAQEAGRHEMTWDGLDDSGLLQLLKHPNLNLNLNAFSLPDNAILLKGAARTYAPPDAAWQPAKEGRHLHAVHPRLTCHEPRFHVTFPESSAKDARGVVQLKGKVPVHVALEPQDAAELIRRRFEVIVYVDTVFLFEEEQAVTPATFSVDTSTWTSGDHLLTVNIMSYDDHVGTQTMKVQVVK